MSKFLFGCLTLATPLLMSGGNCDASYPDFCIPPPPPDLNCGDISGRNFTVRRPDPHGFDTDHDGVGCEVNRR